LIPRSGRRGVSFQHDSTASADSPEEEMKDGYLLQEGIRFSFPKKGFPNLGNIDYILINCQ
jgi:hypothetical protein